jgi:hypothetical protein
MTIAQDRAAFESFLDCVQGGAGKDAIAGCLAENVVLIGPLSDEPLTGREAVAEAIQTVYTLAADLTYEEVLSGETHHAAFFRLQSKTPWSTEWTTPCSTRTARSPR